MDIGYRNSDDNRKGSLTLRSDHMNYSRAILNSKWHQAREAEPKDYDMNKHPIRSLAFSTYKRIGNVTDGSFPDTTYQAQTNQIYLKPLYEVRDTHKPLVQLETVASANAGIDRDTGEPKGVFGSALPSHGPEHNKYYLDTTYISDYVPPYPFTRCEEDTKSNQMKQEEMEDKSSAFKKMKSQFTDTADYRRNGWNTWQDESGVYANSHFKAQVFAKTETIPERPV
ncbi:cilia- and flagella-associated protein 95-like [Biomphalaria glabrata]|uniref:Cilia- and flagella-associated protein 95-like n=1 Tax=Biomphalaria glabrata TaxID=6526 RepID=A0A9W3AB53_BIOGL|nr:cilia- and flagella-associated protein 95-like [Biomphalaria glabrata]